MRHSGTTPRAKADACRHNSVGWSGNKRGEPGHRVEDERGLLPQKVVAGHAGQRLVALPDQP